MTTDHPRELYGFAIRARHEAKAAIEASAPDLEALENATAAANDLLDALHLFGAQVETQRIGTLATAIRPFTNRGFTR